MNIKNMIIYVSKSGRPYNRSEGKNESINLGASYLIGSNGTVVFTLEESTLYVTKYTSNNIQGYRTQIKKPGMYIVTGFCVVPLPSTPKEARLMYNRIKYVVNNRAKFSIDPVDLLPVPFKILLTIRQCITRLELVFHIKINTKLLDPEIILEAEDLISKTLSFDQKVIRSFINTDRITDTYISIDKNFISAASEFELNQNTANT